MNPARSRTTANSIRLVLFNEVTIRYLLCCVHQTSLRGQSLSSGRCEKNVHRCLDQQLVKQDYCFSFRPPGRRQRRGCV